MTETPLSVLIACEYSGVMRRAFRALGHDAWSCDLLPAEKGATITDFPLYVVTSLGRIISYQTGVAREMKPRPHRAGYKIVTLCNGGRQATTTIHRLVAAAFIPNPGGHPLVRHVDGDRSNNAADNLAWGTYSDNEADKIGHGTRRYGTAKMKLNRQARTEALALAAAGVPRSQIAARFQVNQSTITRLVNGTTWANRKWPIAEKAAQR